MKSACDLPLPSINLALGLLILATTLDTTKPLVAQSTLPLSAQQCEMNNAQRFTRKISVGRELRSSLFRINAGPLAGGRRSQMTCSLNSTDAQRFKTLQLSFGLPDREYRAVTVFVFLDGQLVSTEQLQPGTLKQLALNVRSRRNVAIEVEGESSYRMYPYVYILNAALVQ